MSRLHAVVFDWRNPAALARWWADVLDYEVRPYTEEDLAWLREQGLAGPEEDPSVAIDDPSARGPVFWFNRVPEGKTGKNRLHLDVGADPDDLVAKGATVVLPEADDRGWTVLADPEGNEFCASTRWIASSD
jgi:hypothetical protein